MDKYSLSIHHKKIRKFYFWRDRFIVDGNLSLNFQEYYDAQNLISNSFTAQKKDLHLFIWWH